MFEGLDAVLARRRSPIIPEGLSERIIAASFRVQPEREAVGKGCWRKAIGSFFDELADFVAVPRPAYVMALMLVLGLSMGLYSDYLDTSFLPGVSTSDLSTFMRIDDRFVAYDFLHGASL